MDTVQTVLQFVLFNASTMLFACLAATIAGGALTLAGFVLMPDLLVRRLDLDGFDFFIVGMTVFVLGCWAVVKQNHSVVPVIVVLMMGGPLLLIVRAFLWGRHGEGPIRAAAIRLAPTIRPLIFFNLSGVVIYVLHYADLSSDVLPFTFSGNLDLFHYGNIAMFLRNASSGDAFAPLHSNVAGYDFLGFATHDAFGAFSLLSLIQFLPHRNLYDFAIPAMLLTAGGCSLVVLSFLKNVFGIKGKPAAFIVVLTLTNSLNFYIIYNYFYSQTLATLFMLCLVYGTVRRYQGRDYSAWQQVLVAFPIYFLQLFCYWPGVLLTLAVHFLLLVVLESLRRPNEKSLFAIFFSLKNVFSALWVFALMVMMVAGFALVFPSRVTAVREALAAFANSGTAGWPLGLVSPFVLVGVGPLGLSFEGDIVFSWICYGVIVPIVVAAPILLHVERGRVLRRWHAAFAAELVFVFLLSIYVIYYMYTGRSYQQWKLASYGPAAFCWIALAQMALASERLGERFQRLRRWVPTSLPVVFFLWFSLEVNSNRTLFAPVQIPSNIETISAVNDLNIDQIVLDLDGSPPLIANSNQMIAPGFIRRPTLYMAWGTYLPRTTPPEYHPSRQFPLLANADACGKPGEDGIEPLRNGFVLVTRSFFSIGTTINFRRAFCDGLVDATGVGSAEDGGRWTEGNESRFHLHLDPHQIAGDLAIVLTAGAYPGPSGLPQIVEVIVNGVSLATWDYVRADAESHRVVIPHAIATERPDLEIVLRLPNAISLAGASRGADHRIVALMLQSLAIVNAAEAGQQ